MKDSVYTPGAGHQPPVLAGRDELLRDFTLMMSDVANRGRVRARDMIVAGPRGVGKTALVSEFTRSAAAFDFEIIQYQAVQGTGGLVDTIVRCGSRRLDAAAQTTQPDAADLANLLANLAEAVRSESGRGGVMLAVDEMQVSAAHDLSLLAAALHRLNVEYPEAPVLFAGTGLPHIQSVLREAGVTHPDRLFVVEHLPVSLGNQDSLFAVVEPARRAGVSWDPEAASHIVTVSGGYPAHLQLFADSAWQMAEGPSDINVRDTQKAIPYVTAQLEKRTLGDLWQGLSDREIEYLAAVAVLNGKASSAQLTQLLDRETTQLSTVRDSLIKDGVIYSPRRGAVSLTMPIFTQYIVDRYEEARSAAAVDLVSLESLRGRVVKAL